ncbi:MAG: CPBP family intramembrane glutamic endopeptidase [Bryobacteraceae bacterium]
MTNTSPSLPPPEVQNTRFSVVIRVAFFVALVIVSRFAVTVPLLAIFGALVAASVGLYLAGILANLSTMRVFDRRPLADIGLQVNVASGRNLALGILLGGGAAALMLWAPLLAGTGHLVAKSDTATNIPSLIFYLAALLFAAMGEELIFRGYAFQLLIEKMGPFATILPVSVLFGFAHGMNPNASRLGIANTVLWGILLGYAFLRTHDLWLPIGLHFGWNAVLPLFGVNLSGHTIDVTRYTYRWDLMPVWSGGNYGPEGGLLATIFVVSLFFALMKAPVVQQLARVAPSLNDPV